ncbi:LamG domain-containing protein [Delftia sp. BR1]|nr:LamG domain-containing protein [Delftia sp. BR1]
MAAHRYWRASGIEPYDNGSVIALTEFQLLAGTTRVDTSATLTASNGANVAALSDGAAGAAVNLPRGVALTWDFGASPQDVTDIRLGAGPAVQSFPLTITLQSSDDAVVWERYGLFSGIAYPGAGKLTQSEPRLLFSEFEETMLAIEGRGPDGSTAIIDSTGLPLSVRGTTAIRTSARFPDGAIRISQAGELIVLPVRDLYDFGTGDMGVRFQYERVAQGGSTPCILSLYDWVAANGGLAFFDGHTLLPGKLGVALNGSYPVLQSLAPLAAGVKYDVEFSRVGNSVTLRINGALQGSANYSGVIKANNGVWIGTSGDAVNGSFINGYVRRVQFKRGKPLHTADYTPDDALIAATRVLMNKVQGRSTPAAVANVASAGAMPPVGKTLLGLVGKSRTNYLFDRAAQGRIRGTVERDASPADVPLRRRVSLLRDIDMMIVAQQWSDAVTGAYDFQYIETDQAYTVIAHDYEHNYRAVIADNLSLASGGMELMP